MAEPTYADVMTALRNADASGNVEDASKLAAIASRLSTPESPKNSKYDDSQSNVQYQANRFQKGAANLLALPAELVRAGANVASMASRKTIPGYGIAADYLNSLAPNFQLQSPMKVIPEALSDTTMKAPSRAAEVMGGISEFAGGGVLPSAAVIGRAAHKIPAVASEIGSTAMGGVGMELYGLPGAIAGSLAGFQTGALFSKAQALVSGAVPWLRSKSQSAAPAELNAAITANPASGANAAMSENVAQNIQALGGGAFRPTLGAQTGAPGIIAREEQIAGSSPEALSKYATRRAENEAAVSRATDSAFPAGGDIRRTAGDVKLRASSQLELRLNEINKSREALAARVQANPQQRTGEALDKLRDQAEGVARNIKNTKIQDVYKTADDLKINEDMSDVLANVRRVGGSDENIFQNLPPVFAKIITQYAPKSKELIGRSIPPDIMAMQTSQSAPKTASFKEIHSLWREANTQYGTALRSGDSQSQYYLQQVRESLKAKLDKFEQSGFGDLTDKFRDFNRFYATKYAPAFKEGVGGRMDASGRYGDIVKKEDVVSKFFTPSGIDDFNLIYSGDKAAQTALADGIVGLFRQAAVKNGKIDQRAAQEFIRTNEGALDKVLDIKAILQKPAAANEALLEAAARTRQNISDFNKSAVARIAKTENPDALIDKALTDKRSMMQLITLGSAGGESSTNAVLRSIADRVPAAAAKQKVDPFSFVVNNESLLKPALDRLGKDHFENLKTIAGAKTILGRTEVPTTVGATKTVGFLEEVTGSTPRTIWSQSANTSAGRQSPVSAGLHLLSRYGIKAKEENAVKMMAEAIYNPEIAATWAKMAKGSPLSIPEANKLRNHFIAAGIRIAADQQGQ